MTMIAVDKHTFRRGRRFAGKTRLLNRSDLPDKETLICSLADVLAVQHYSPFVYSLHGFADSCHRWDGQTLLLMHCEPPLSLAVAAYTRNHK